MTANTNLSPMSTPPIPKTAPTPQIPRIPTPAPIPPEFASADMLKADDEGAEYKPKFRKLTSFGGLDLVALGPALQRMRATKEQYGNSMLTQNQRI